MCVDIYGIPHIVSYLYLVLLRPPLSYQVKTFLAFCPAGDWRQVLRGFPCPWFGVLILAVGCDKSYYIPRAL